MVTQAVPLTQHPLFNLPAVVAQRLVKFPQMSGKTVYVRVLVIEFQRIDNQVCRFSEVWMARSYCFDAVS